MKGHLNRGLLHRYLDGDLTPKDMEQVRAHLSGCRSCQEALEGLRQADLLWQQMAVFEVPQDFTLQVMARVRPAPALWDRRVIAWLAAGLALVGALLLALVGWEVVGQVGWQAWPTTADLSDPLGLWEVVGAGLLALGETATPLGLGLLALGTFLSLARRLASAGWAGSGAAVHARPTPH